MRLAPGKGWQWLVLGLGAGLVLALGRLASQATELVGGPGYIDQRTFESELRRKPAPDEPQLTGLSIHLAGEVDLVELTYRVPAEGGEVEWRKVKFAAPRPYMAIDSVPGRLNPSVREYLDGLAAIVPLPAIRLHWWETPFAKLSLFALAGLILVGGGPFAARVLRGRLHGARGTSSGPLTAAQPNAGCEAITLDPGEQQQIMAEAPMTVHAAVPALSDGPLLSNESAAAPADKEYSGEFYPVERRSPHGFSLIELLVVTGVIAVLVSFLLPATRLARAHANTARCAAQLRQIGIALHAYASANGGWLPAWSGWHTWPPGQSDDEPGPAWTIELMPYIGTPDSPVYNCPAWPGPARCRNYFLESQWSGRSGRHAMKLSDIVLSGRFVLSGDKTNLALYPPPFGAGSSQDDADPDDFGSTGALLWPWAGGFYMHPHGNNVLFDDTHVELCSRFDPRRVTFNPHRVEDWAEVTGN